jgi:uncharacterized PurR-regulated membrane protein YhhQ (DUF165 family)
MKQKNRSQVVSLLAFFAYLLSIPFANWLIENIGNVRFPGGPHVIPVGFGLEAPTGVLAIGFALVARDYVQHRLGKKYALAAIAVGVVLSFFINSDLAWASALAFTFGELSDFAVYTPLQKKNTFAAVLLSGLVGGVVDSLIFLQVAFGSTQYWQGQVLGKTWMAIIGAIVLSSIKNYRGSEKDGVLV